MAKEKINLELPDPQKDIPYTKNMFTPFVGDKYAKKFHEIYYADITDRDQKMMELIEEAKNDTNLKDNQKLLLQKCVVAYNAAVGKNCKVSGPIILYMEKKKPALSKFINNETRIKRIVQDMYDMVTKSGFYFEIYNFPVFIKIFLVQFGQKDKEYLDSDEFETEATTICAFGRFIRTLPITAVTQIWYALMFMKNIASYAYMKAETYNEHEFLKPQVASIINTINLIKKMEDKRKEELNKKESAKQDSSTS